MFEYLNWDMVLQIAFDGTLGVKCNTSLLQNQKTWSSKVVE